MESLYKGLLRDPGYQQDVRKRMSAMPWQRAVPDTKDIVKHHAGAMARAEMEGTEHTERLAMSERIHADEMGLKREGLDLEKGQGRMATGLSVANLGLQGFAGILQIKDANKKVQLINEAIEQYRQTGDTKGYWNAMFLKYLVE